MINELYQLTEAIDAAEIQPKNWHPNYNPIRKIQPKTAPCICIDISDGKVVKLSEVPEEYGRILRKFGNNQGTYPCMNLAPLYRISENDEKALKKLKPEEFTQEKIEEIKGLCQEYNWSTKFQKKYKICMGQAAKLREMLPSYEPIQRLTDETSWFHEDPDQLHQKLKEAAFELLERREPEGISVALQVLFHPGKEQGTAENDFSTFSAAFDATHAIEPHAVSSAFVSGLNEALLAAKKAEPPKSKKAQPSEKEIPDAFGVLFVPESEPMPKVKLAGGFDASLRTMFNAHCCQYRYRRADDESYPVSQEMRAKLSSALDWLGAAAERENVTWMRTGKDEILFAYPSQLPEEMFSFTSFFGGPSRNDATFEAQAERFLEELRHSRKPGADSRADKIQLFILKKLDKARTKILYTRQTNAYELEQRSEAWTTGCANLPPSRFGDPKAPFPLDAADILNRFWKQSGEPATDKFKPVPKYHGLELLMEPETPVTADLHMLAEQAMSIGAFLGRELLTKERLEDTLWRKIKNMLALTGLMLDRNAIRKDAYMEDFPYLYGQLLKVSDELHAMYCRVVRNDSLPSQLIGGSVYQAAAETPLRTLNLLGTRMNPYIAWAKTYRPDREPPKGQEEWRAKWPLDCVLGFVSFHFSSLAGPSAFSLPKNRISSCQLKV